MDPLEAARAKLVEAFGNVGMPPAISLRGGNALDDYEEPPPFDPELDRPTDEYIERYYHGIHFLDADSWHHYLPVLLGYALGHPESESMALDTLLFSLDPRNGDYPVFPCLSSSQAAAVRGALEVLLEQADEFDRPEFALALERVWEIDDANDPDDSQ